MITYLVLDLKKKKFQVGSTVSENTGRPYVHFTDRCPNKVLRNATRKRPEDFFVFISEDDGLDTREAEQESLDFYFGTKWCYNLSPHAEGGFGHIDNNGKVWANNGESQKMVHPDEIPEGWVLGKLPTGWSPTEEQRQATSDRVSGDKNPFCRPEVREKLSKIDRSGAKNSRFGVELTQTTKDRIAEGNKKSKDYTCPHCGKTCKAGDYTRWHGDNCKEKD